MILKAIMPGLMFLTTICAVPAVAAESVRIGKAEVQLTYPEAFCPFLESEPSDSRALSIIQSGLAGRNRLLGAYGLCDELPKWRSGKLPLLSDLLQFQTLIALMGQKLPRPHARFMKQFCDQFRQQGQKLLNNVAPEVNKRIAAVSDTLRVNEQRILGVIDEPEEKCSVLIVQKINAETGAQLIQLAVFVPVVVKEKLIFSYLFVPYDESVGAGPAAERLRVIVREMETANGG